MSGDLYLVNFPVVEAAANTYKSKANEIGDMLRALNTSNTNLHEGFKNNAADRFFDRYEAEYRPAMQNVQEALEEISNFLTRYVDEHRNS